MFKISSLIRQDREFRASLITLKEEYMSKDRLPTVINGLSGGAELAYLAESIKETRKILKDDKRDIPTLVLVPNDDERNNTTDYLNLCGVCALAYKPRDLVLYNVTASHDVDRERLSVLSAILNKKCDCVVTTVGALIGHTMPISRLKSLSVEFSVGDEYPPEELTDKFTSLGFARVDNVESVGQFAQRGGIVDFWSGDLEAPVRVEFFGDEIDRMVYFDPISQRSGDECRRVSILPAREMIIDDKARERILKAVNSLLHNDELTEDSRAKLEREKSALEAGVGIDFRDKYMALIYDTEESLIDYFNSLDKTFIFVRGTLSCKEEGEAVLKKYEDNINTLVSKGLIKEKIANFSDTIKDYEAFLLRNMIVHINPFAGGVGNIKLSGLFGFRCRRTVAYGDNPRMLQEDLTSFRKGLYRVVLLAENHQGAKSIISTLSDMEIPAVDISEKDDFDITDAKGGTVFVGVGNFEGFDLLGPKVAVLSLSKDKGRAVMERKRQQRVLRRVGGAGKKIMSHADLSVGDYVVHANYGIGRFEGIETVTVDGVTKDYITIQYAGTDKLFVPCDRLEMIGKYIGDRDKDGGVKLSKMGGTDWAKTKSRAKAAAKDIAKDLIRLYAERQRRPGFAFPQKCELEDEFDSQFAYEETESQLIAIEEIKADMMKSVPMNRLLCGDVGFGKTEVALRAAFKAILGGKQVAILVPTTILALQHYQTALSRMRGYPVTVEMISRFKKPKERKDILERTAKGTVDLLIGTHALLSKAVKFHDLGLLIIDEEQRFGVVQKEKLREMAKNVDTLMLSATPIPRTLNMSMSGINDISVLDEAPGERHPVQTYVVEHDDDMIAIALQRELDRGGQVLYVYNKVEDIDLVAGRLTERLPYARIAYAHGKMDKEELEDIWQMLVRGEIDILVCTTIIETGVDLPNANTLVIENADKFGLSQLHQIRGRVGRSERQAYAFFTYKPDKSLSEVAQKRLEAIKEFAEFGAGFKIALRDLEIRGAGNILGTEQHGYIESVGYDLYIKLLNEAVLEESGKTEEKPFESQIVINISAHIPEKYISTPANRMEMYKKISLIESEEDATEVTDEFIDRFGDMPKPTERLVNVALAKALASACKVKKVEVKDNRITFVEDKPDLASWSEVFAKFKNINFAGLGSSLVVYRMRKDEDPLNVMIAVLRVLKKAKEE